MSNFTFWGKDLDVLTMDELVTASAIMLSDYQKALSKGQHEKAGEYMAVKSAIQNRIDAINNQTSKTKQKVRFFVEHKGDIEEINLYWFEENHIRTYEDLKYYGYSFAVDIGDDVTFTI